MKQWAKTSKSSQPVPYACRMPRFQKMDSLNEVVTEFVEAAKADLEGSGTPPRNRRQKYLFSTPLLLTGMGGMRSSAGAVAQVLCPHLEALAARTGVDILLVVVEEAVFSMLQTWRRRNCSPESFALLSAEDKCKAEELALLGEKGVLSLFVGAGVSVGAGLPTWGTLLEAIAKEAAMSKARLLVSLLSASHFPFHTRTTRRGCGRCRSWTRRGCWRRGWAPRAACARLS